MDITIQRGNYLPEFEQCTDCCQYFHCPFCSPKWFLPNTKSKVLIHLKKHFNRSVAHGGYTIHRCCRLCRDLPHYHCPYCNSTLLRRKDFKRHLEMDITIQRGDTLPEVKRCTDCCSNFHCPFCAPKWYRPTGKSKIELHLKIHFNRAVRFAGYTIHRCRRTCRKTSHYHCPYCKSTLLRTLDFTRHLQLCRGKDAAETAAQFLTAEDTTEPGNATPVSNKEEKEKPKCAPQLCTAGEQNGQPNQSVHVTVQRGDSLPNLEKCSNCSNIHCPFCSTKMFRPSKKSRIVEHLKKHFNYSVKFEGFTIHRCRRTCRTVPHYHCPYCKSSVLRTMDFMRHLQVCKSKDASLIAVQSPSAAEDMSKMANATPVYKNITWKRPNLKQKKNTHLKCPKCHLVFYRKNLKKHIERKHSLQELDISAFSHLKSECVDPQNGVYAVHNIIRGVSRPLHVQLKMQGEVECFSCDSSLCQSKLELARSEVKSYKCKHLQSVSNCTSFPSSPVLPQSILAEMARKKLFAKSKIKVCTDRQILAMQNNVPLSVQLMMGNPPYKKFISVYEPNISVYSRLRRIIVSCNEEKNLWYCPCSRTKRTCVHKYVAKWHLFQTDRSMFHNKVQTPSKPRNKKTKIPKAQSTQTAKLLSKQRAEADVESDEDTALETIETMEAIEPIDSMVAAMETNVTYPPKDIQMIRSMVQYLLINKRLPALFPEHLSVPVEKDYPRHLAPTETNCLYCTDEVILSQPVLITHKAKILTYSRILQDFSTYYKFCPRCGVPYRYQEWGDGLHNFNDHLLLDLPLCLMIRNTLHAHTSFGQIVESLKSNRGASFPTADTLLRGYLHFEALTDSQSQYSCVTYGNRPPVVVMELNSKTFHLSGRDLAEPTADLNGAGDMDHLWKALKEERIARGLVSGTKQPVLYKIM
ncbi:uncharacterized protein LOC117381996 [Periophthalmus magnuspinnatus]|uniref:uncharacterized protein LOC117381996 n=1 Tax=Periophthalmus magnuspinnatus TaxID=409849 RepID=UPI0024366524|nr:uncharacterized protein LOC117381996 [Periophthalmus magnuspinnatus]